MANDTKVLRCAIYTRKSTEHGLEQEFNSLDAQREACEAYIKSQAFQGWKALPQQYNDPAYSGGNLDRPALKKLLADIEAGRVDVVVVYRSTALPVRSPISQNWLRPLTLNRSRSWPSPSSSIPPRPWAG
jgi:DNA invertase Pin-like site-specific DNA recombinase